MTSLASDAMTQDARMSLDSDGPTLGGLWVPLITPFDIGDRIDATSLERLARRVLLEGAAGLVALGTTGEPSVLTSSERAEVLRICSQVCIDLGRPLMVGVGTNCTRSTIEAVSALEGASAALVVVPYYTRPSPEGVIEHFRAVAAASPVPVVAYNVPYRTGRGLTWEELLHIAELPNVDGLKQAVGTLDVDTLELLRRAPDDFAVLAGDDAFIVPTILMGGTGSITASAHVRTAAFAEMVDAALRRDVLHARGLAEELLPIIRLGFSEPNPASWKGVLHRMGELATDTLRSPMLRASDSLVDQMAASLGSDLGLERQVGAAHRKAREVSGEAGQPQ